MLQLSAINTPTLELLNQLMLAEEFKNMRLAGGTALALQLGHRKSIDLDFFGVIDFDHIYTSNPFSSFKQVTTLKRSKNINIFSINNIKVDFVNYSYPWLHEPIIENSIRLAATEDIAAMKLAAITGKGSKKDFIDLNFLLQTHTLQELLDFYKKKYHDGSEFLVLKSLTYFDDANTELGIEMLKDIPWTHIKAHLLHTVTEYNHNIQWKPIAHYP